MNISTALRALAFASAAILLAACEYSPDTVDRTLAFNRQVATSTNDLLLLNAVRASRRLPTYYSRLTGDTAQSTITPGLSAAIPWQGSKSIATAVATGGGSSGTITTTLGRVVSSLTSSLSATEQNQLALTNMDDQASINGMMTPVPMPIYQFFQSEGINHEELMLLFMEDVQISKDDLNTLAGKRPKTCGLLDNQPRAKWCRSASEADATTECNSVLPDDSTTVAVIPNDPALFRTNDDNKKVYSTFACFQSIVRLLLALDMQAESSTKHKVLYCLPMDSEKSNSRYLADLTQQNLEVAVVNKCIANKPSPDAKTSDHELQKALQANEYRGVPAHGYIAVCKKTDEVVFKFAKDVSHLTFTTNDSQGKDNASKDSASSDAKTCAEAANPDLPKPVAPDTNASATIAPVSADAAKASVTVSFDMRSFEAMVYYIGQIIRRKVDLADSTPVKFLAADHVAKELFDIETGVPPQDAAAQVWENGRFYYVPSICGDDDCLGAEYPSHFSPQVLTLLNQIWDLQKSATTPPAVSNVTVISPP